MGIYASYGLLRLRWYLRASGQALLRHWQWLLLAALLVPGVPVLPLLSAGASLLDMTVSTDLAWSSRLAGQAAVLLLAALWVLPQRRNILGGEFASYAATLPISSLAKLGVDVTTLLAADLLPLLFFATALMRGDGSSAARLLLLLAVAVAIQLWVLRRHQRSMLSHRVIVSRGWNQALPPGLLIQLQVLSARKATIVLRMVSTLVIAATADRLILAFGFDARSLPTAIIAVAIICLVASGIYRPLLEAHRGAARFLATLPLPPSYWPVRDSFLVALFGTPALALVLVWLALSGLATASGLLVLALATAGLIVVLRLPLVWGGRLSVFLAVLTTSLWAGIAIAAVLR